MEGAPSADAGTQRPGETALIIVALAGVVLTLGIAALRHDRLWHEGVAGFVVAVAFSIPVARWRPQTWQQRTGKILLTLASLTVVIFAAIIALYVVILVRGPFPP